MDPLDRHIAEAVNIDPSPAFVARVRARVAAEGAPRRRTSSFVLTSVVVAATALLAVWTTLADRAPRPPAHVATSAAPARTPVPVAHLTETTLATPERGRTTRDQRRQTAARVIVAPDEIRAMNQLAELARGGVAVSFEDGQPASQPVKDIVVAPIQIAPLAIASITAAEGDEQ